MRHHQAMIRGSAPVAAGLAVFGALTGISAVAALLTGVRLAG